MLVINFLFYGVCLSSAHNFILEHRIIHDGVTDDGDDVAAV